VGVISVEAAIAVITTTIVVAMIPTHMIVIIVVAAVVEGTVETHTMAIGQLAMMTKLQLGSRLQQRQ